MDLNAQAPDEAAAYIMAGSALLTWVIYQATKFIDSFISTKTKLVWEDVVMFSLLGVVTQLSLALDTAGMVKLEWLTVPQAIAANIAVIPVYVSLTWLFVMWVRGDYDKPSTAQQIKRPIAKIVLNIVSALGGIVALCVIPVLM